MEQDKMMSVETASDLLGVSERTARRYCEQGKLDHQKQGKIYRIDRESVENLAKKMGVVHGLSRDNTASGTDNIDGVDETMSEASGNGQQAEQEPVIVDLSIPELDDLFADVRTLVDLHLRRVQEFHQASHSHIDQMERALTFEQGRNAEIQRGLVGIFTGLGQSPEEISTIAIDPRLKPNRIQKVRNCLSRLKVRWWPLG